MVIFKKVADLQVFLSLQHGLGRTIGLVPTMGALHAGHLSLIAKAKADNTLVVCSIFVNPTQFNDREDFLKYPSSVDTDIAMLIDAGCDALLLPSVEEMYPMGVTAQKSYDFGYLDTILEGANRPGHFKGVGQVVGRLLEIIHPEYLYMGQKDYQQCMVVRSLLQKMDLDGRVHMVICPTQREADGLAMSSRNRRLTEPQRNIAGILYQCLVSIQSKMSTAKFEIVKKECFDLLKEKGFEPDYVALADARDLALLNEYDADKPMVALIAAKIGNIRLIDNMLINQA